MSIVQPIGYVKTNIDSKDLEYTIASCDYYTKGSTISGQHLCSLFRIDSFTGLFLLFFLLCFLFKNIYIYYKGFIFTNASNYASYVDNYFVLKVRASFVGATFVSGQNAFIDLKVFVVNYQEKSELVFRQAPQTQLIDTLTFIKG